MSIPTVFNEDDEPMDPDFSASTVVQSSDVVSPITATSQHAEGWREEAGLVDSPAPTPETSTGFTPPVQTTDLAKSDVDAAIEAFDQVAAFRERLASAGAINRAWATEAHDLAPGAGLRHLGSFTEHPTITNYDHSLEALDRWLTVREAQLKQLLQKD